MKIFNYTFTMKDKSTGLFSRVFFFSLIWILIIFSAASLYGSDLLLPPGPPNGNGLFPPISPTDGNGLVKRKVPSKPFHTVVGEGVYRDLIIIKFVEGSDVRLRNGLLMSLKGINLGGLQSILAQYKVKKIKGLFSRPEQDLENERQKGQQMSGEELADLNLYHMLRIDKNTDPEALINALNSLDVVEIAYPEPIPYPAMANPYDIPPATPNFVFNQGYLNNPPQGIGARQRASEWSGV